MLHLHFLGSPEVWFKQQLLTFPTRKTLALLIYLAVEKGLHPREKLQTLLWPDNDSTRGRGALRTTLAYLRRAVETTERNYLIIEGDALGFNFNSDFQLDLDVANQANQTPHLPLLETTIKLYRGDFLEGFSLPDAPAFDEWASRQQEYWHRHISLVFTRLSQLQSEARQFEAGIATAIRWVAQDSLNETAYRRLMQFYLMAGQRPAALQVYESCRNILIKELGIAPSAETNALAEQIRRMKSGEAFRPLHPSSPIPHPSSFKDLPFVGRAAEHTRLAAAYQLAGQGQIQAVVIEGEAGIGKTRLAAEFLSWLQLQGADVLEGLAFEAGGRLPYQPVIDALRERIERENAPDDLLSDVWLAELSRLLPELRERYPDLPAATPDESLAHTRLLEAVVRLGHRLAQRRPVVLFMDDLQWADTASLDLLHYVSQRWAESRSSVLLLLAVRAEALVAVPTLAEWLTNLERVAPLSRLSLQPVTAADTVQLVNILAGAPPIQLQQKETSASFAHWLFHETAGQPFFMAETVKALFERGMLRFRQKSAEVGAIDFSGMSFETSVIPSSVRQVILARLNRLSTTATALLTAASVIGRNCSFERLGQVAGVGEFEGLPALDELLSSRLLLETHEPARPYRFVHDKIRDVVYTEAGDARRRIYHRRAFEGLETKSAPPAELAHHALAARLHEPAFRYSLAAGDGAMAVFAVRDAIAHYEQALSLVIGNWGLVITNYQLPILDHQHLHLQLGRAYELVSEWTKAQALYESMLSLAQTLKAPAMECAALNRLATLMAQQLYDIAQATNFLQQAIQVAESCGEQGALAEAEWNLAQIRVYVWDMAASLLHAQRALGLARQLSLPELTARSLNIMAFTEGGLAKWVEAKTHAQEAVTFYQQLGNKALEADSLCAVARAWVNLGHPQAALEPGQAAYGLTLESDNTWGQAVSALNVGFALLESTQWSQALAVAQTGVHLAQAVSGFAPLPILNLTVLGMSYRAMLNLEAAQAAHRAAVEISQSRPHQPLLRMSAGELAVDCAMQGNWDEAYHLAHQSLAAHHHSLLHGGLQHWYLIEALLRGGDSALARTEAERFGGQYGHSRRYQLPYQRCLAVLAHWHGDTAQAIKHLAAALTLAEDIGLPGEQWSILAKLGELYQANGNEEKAGEAMRRGMEIVETLAAKIEDEGLRTGFLGAALKILSGAEGHPGGR